MANPIRNYQFARGPQGNVPHHEAAMYAAGQLVDDAAYAARRGAGAVGNAAIGVGGAALGAATLPLRYPVPTVLTAGAITGANHLLGDPIGHAAQGIGNVMNGAEWDAQYSNPTQANAYNNLGATGDNLYQQQLNDSMMAAERAGRFQRQLEAEAANQGYSQELGLQVNRLQAEREMQENQLAAAQANQLLNGYLDMINAASQRAAAAAGNRY